MHRLLSIAHIAAILAVAGSITSSMHGQIAEPPSDHRMRESRPTETIFSPLDLPDANHIRTGSGAPGHEYWQQQVDYKITTALDPETYELTGSADVLYYNNSPDSLDYIWIHLEQNVFRADSVGAKIAGNNAIGMSKPQGSGVKVTRIAAGDQDVTLTIYDTIARLDLPKPLKPGHEFRFEIDWTFFIPENVFRRFGIEQVQQGQIIEVAQWFPAVAVYDDYYGWNTAPYLGAGEFYTNFGDYEVSITVPREYIVVATGELQNFEDVFTDEQLERFEEARETRQTTMIIKPSEVGTDGIRPEDESPTLTWKFHAEDVRTFAFATSNAFIYDAATYDGILIQSVYPKEAFEFWKYSTQMLIKAIEGYNERWFKYPYPVATNVNGIEGGMEYPMIIFCRNRTNEKALYGVTTHEIGHNWFPMMVNTDERRHAWMDEGFNSFINYYSYGDWFEGQLGRRGNAARFARKMKRENLVPIATAPDQLPRNQLGLLQYEKTAVGLVLLREQILGPERFDHAFRTYINRWAFKSPRPADFFRTIEDVAGADLAWFWRGWFYESSNLDQAVGSVEQDANNNEVSVEIWNMDELVMPVNYGVKYDDGSEEMRHIPVEAWFTTNRYKDTWMSGRTIVEVVIDPNEGMPDIKRDNNRWSATGHSNNSNVIHSEKNTKSDDVKTETIK